MIQFSDHDLKPGKNSQIIYILFCINVHLFIKRLRVMGLPIDLFKIIEVWLTNRKFYVDLDG